MLKIRHRLAGCGGLLAALSAVLLLFLLSAQAQYGGWRGGRFGRGFGIPPERQREQDEMAKALNPAFKEDVFTFARLRFQAERGFRYGGRRTWDDDAPEADLNLIFRLYQVTSLKVRPGLNFIDITAQDLARNQTSVVSSANCRPPSRCRA